MQIGNTGKMFQGVSGKLLEIHIHASTDGVGFSICRHTFKMVAMTSFHYRKVLPPGECTVHTLSAEHLCSSVRQFLIYSTFALVQSVNQWIIVKSRIQLVCRYLLVEAKSVLIRQMSPVLFVGLFRGVSRGGPGRSRPPFKSLPRNLPPNACGVEWLHYAMNVLVTSLFLAFSDADIEFDFVLMTSAYSQYLRDSCKQPLTPVGSQSVAVCVYGDN